MITGIIIGLIAGIPTGFVLAILFVFWRIR